jgi:hypothetical protein
MVPAYLKPASWYGWADWFVAVLATAAVEPPLFIGFSLLADPERNLASRNSASLHSDSLPVAQQAADI